MREELPRPFFDRRDEHHADRPHHAHAAETVAGLLASFEERSAERVAEISDHHDKEHFAESFRHLDELAIAFDALAAFRSHGYRVIKRRAYVGSKYLKAEVWSHEGEGPTHVEVLRCIEGDGSVDGNNHAEWTVARRIPADVLGEISEGGLR
jgi:hypothetical protein